jgi:hypothetical protein
MEDLAVEAEKWSEQDVIGLLRDLGMPQYERAFVDSEVTGAVLYVLDESDLCNDLGIANGIHRKRILLSFHKALGGTWSRVHTGSNPRSAQPTSPPAAPR